MNYKKNQTFEPLYNIFSEPKTICDILKTAVDSINENIELIKNGINNKHIEKVYGGCHTLHGMAFVGNHKCFQIANMLTELLRNENNFEYIQTNTNNIIELFQELYAQCDILIIEIANELSNINDDE